MDISGLGRRATSLITSAVVVLVALAVWWLQGGTDDSDTSPTNIDTSATTIDTSAGASDTSAAPSDTSAGADAMPEFDEVSGLPYVALEVLPAEAAATVALIDEGGPFPYDKDGSTFRNFEGLLPDRDDGYYREYTVDTPGSEDRGARRIIGGADGELYWTEDHYESFEVIWR